MQAHVPFESLLEADLIILMDADPHVSAFWAQPETFIWNDNAGNKRTYTPDFLVRNTCGEFLYREVKPSKVQDRNPTLSGRRSDIEHECRIRGAYWELWTEVQIRREPQYSNARHIRRSADTTDYKEFVEALRRVLKSRTSFGTAGELLGAASLPASAFRLILGLAAKGEILLQIDTPLGPDTRII